MENLAHSVYDPLRGRGRRARVQGNKAVVAAKFEDCSQKLERLSASFAPYLPPRERAAFEDCIVDLAAWGKDTGAQDQTLDYKLRKSKDLHESVIEQLNQLQYSLETGAEYLDENVDFHDSEEDRQLDAEVVYAEAADDEAIASETSTSREKSAEIIEAASTVCEAIQDQVQVLRFLAPSLLRPFPHDVEEYASSIANSNDSESGIGDRADVELAKSFFPTASKILQTRLGHANWKRKLSRKVEQKQSKHGEKGSRQKALRFSKKTTRQEVAQDAFNFQKPFLGDSTVKAPKLFLPLISIPSTAAPSDTASDVHSLWDISSQVAKLPRAGSATTLTTWSSMGLSAKMKAVRLPFQANDFRPPPFPNIPIQLSEGSHELFTCNLCGYDLEAGSKIKTDADWKQHVLEDLEPYLCTFDECFSAQEMYTIRDEWYEHELATHRVKKVWICPACSSEFDTKALADTHLVECLNEDDPESLVMLRQVLRPSLSRQPLGQQVCPLCHGKLPPADTKEHIAQHLETFALFSLQTEETSEEDESDEILSQTNDDVMSERGRKEAVLRNFAKEQLKLNVERGNGPPASYEIYGEDLGPPEDLSEHEGSVDSASNYGGRNLDAKKDLMAKMWGEQEGRGPGGARRSAPRRMLHEPGPPSLASSGDRLPLLRISTFPKNDDFMGREKDLSRLYKILSEPARVCVVSGEGGMGKTALAVEFSYRYEQSYHYIFWIQAETPVGSCETFCQIAQQLNLAPEGSDTDTLIRLGREFLEQVQDKRWLMVFDNVDKWDDIDMYTPAKTSATNGSILITTRHESLTAPSRPTNYFRIALQPLDMDEGRNLLIHGLPAEVRPKERSLRDPEYKIAGEIATLAGLPLLIGFISGYVKQSNLTLTEFWDYWEEWRPKARVASGAAQANDTSDRDSVFLIALNDLAGDARKILEIMAFLDSDGIQRDLLVRNEALNQPGPPYLKHNRFRTIIPNLINQRFVQESRRKHDDRELYIVHRLLQARLLRDMNAKPRKRDEAFKTAFELVRFHLPRPSLDYAEQSKWSITKEYLPHVLSLQRAYADPLSIATPTPFYELAVLFKDGGVVLWQRYILDDALKLLNSAEKILNEIESDDEDLRAEINVTINLLLQYFGISHRKESKDRLARILAYRKRRLERKRPDAAARDDEEQLNNAYADYANALLQFNNYKEAEPIYRACYDKCCELAGGDVGDTGVPADPALAFALAKLNHHMAYCKMYRRDWREAVRLAELAATIIERMERIGGDRQMTLRYQFDLACIVLQSGDKEKALAMHREILQARIGLQGRASYFSLQSQYAYAALCHYLGRLDDAERWMRNALERASEQGGRNFWPDAAVARTKYHLSQVLHDKVALARAGDSGDSGGVIAAPMTPEAEQAIEAEAEALAFVAKDVLSRLLPFDPEPIVGVIEEDTSALFDHLQPVFGGRFTGLALLNYVGAPVEEKEKGR